MKFFSALLSITLICCMLFFVEAYSQSSQMKRCGNIEYEQYLRSINPLYDQERLNTESQLQKNIDKMETEKIVTGQTTFTQYIFPVVVHIVYNTPSLKVLRKGRLDKILIGSGKEMNLGSKTRVSFSL